MASNVNRSQLPQLLDTMRVQGKAWVAAQRRRFRPVARPLSSSERSPLEAWFSPAILDDVRIATAPEIEDPPFYAEVAPDLRAGLIDFRRMAGITFVDLFVARQDLAQTGAAWRSLVFHELVHVVQYGLLGIDGFVDEYVRGWAANGFEYERIPLEVMAYDLEAAFERRDAAFAVESQVRSRLGMAAG